MLMRDCKVWMGPITKAGFGLSSIELEDGKIKNRLAHNLAWEEANGVPKPVGRWVIQTCKNQLCLEPSHLILGTKEEFQENFPNWVSDWEPPKRKVTDEQLEDILNSTDHVERLSERHGVSVNYINNTRRRYGRKSLRK